MPESEFHVGNHDKALGNVYQTVPNLCTQLLSTSNFASIEGFVFGGSYAAGTYQVDNDIDADMLFEKLPGIDTLRILVMTSMAFFAENGLELQIRGCVDRTGSQVTFYRNPLEKPLVYSEKDLRRLTKLYTVHPNSPFVTRSDDVVEYWHLRT